MYVHCCCSVANSSLTLCDPVKCSTPGFPVNHQLPELSQTHVHQVGDAIQPSHLLSSPSPPASVLRIRWPKYWSFSFSISPSNEYWGLISFRIDWWITLQSKGLSRVLFNITVQTHQFFSAQLSLVQLSHPYMTTGKTMLWLYGLWWLSYVSVF